MTLRDLEQVASGCTDCPLHENRTNLVFGEGNPEADLIVIGEAPGEDEDESGRPFVGQSGSLLRDCMESAGIDPDTVYITNTVKCRPPDNRDPRPDETDACANYLRNQLTIIDPELVLTLGTYAAEYCLGEIDSLGSVVGTVHETNYGPVMPLYHPAFILRQRSREDTFQERLGRAYEYTE